MGRSLSYATVDDMSCSEHYKQRGFRSRENRSHHILKKESDGARDIQGNPQLSRAD